MWKFGERNPISAGTKHNIAKAALNYLSAHLVPGAAFMFSEAHKPANTSSYFFEIGRAPFFYGKINFYLYSVTYLDVYLSPRLMSTALSDPLQLPAHVQGGVHAQAALSGSGLLLQPRRAGDAGRSPPRRRITPAILHPARATRP